MSEYSKEKLYYLKMNKDFFDKYYIKILESQPNGDKYVLFLVKLMCESISHNGYLRYNESIPYDEQMLSAITRMDIDVVRTALTLFQNMGIVEMNEDKTIFIPTVQEMTCSTTEGALKKLKQRQTNGGQMSTHNDISNKSLEYRDKSLDIRDKNKKENDSLDESKEKDTTKHDYVKELLAKGIKLPQEEIDYYYEHGEFRW